MQKMKRCVWSAPLNKGAVIDVEHLTARACGRKDKPVSCYVCVWVCVIYWSVILMIDEKGRLSSGNSFAEVCAEYLGSASLPIFSLWFGPLLHCMSALHVSSRKGRWRRQPRGTSTPSGSFLEKALATTWRHLKTWGSPCTSISPAVAEKPT